ncbi:hypothetical protein HYPSUDRAFT_287252 [Hypholoma sublateritium FD-334 SS-4]|uniref:C2H2-type domain-containing protein n=1 Tax=Hypholoma sublateritium (strain FD-334 SS-4) TaxID=945553 RepID=A0A0D2NBT8_HYPSF|nr:hypothetical protein HYPSUDRAFT_287252 [Hypholoma sublateritium FD-334 SS-4]
MHDAGSYSGGDAEGTFNPASFTRHFLGSPISWRASSWGMHNARIPAGSPTAQLLSSIDLNDYRAGKTPSSIESDSIMNALNVFEREGELCRNYTCCGLHLTDLHALLEHFEEVHIVVLDPESAAPQAHIQIPFNPTVHTVPDAQPLPHQGLPHHLQSQQLSQQLPQQRHQQQQQFAQHPQRQQYAQSQPQSQHSQPYATPFDPDDMELDLDLDNTSLSGPPSHPPPPPPSSRSSPSSLAPSSAAPSPPDTPISTPLSAYPSSPGYLPMGFSGAQGQYVSGPPSPLGMSAYGSTAPSTAASTRQNSPSPSANSPESSNSSNANMSTNGRPALSALTFPRSLFPAGFPASGFAGPGFSGAGRGGSGLNNGSTIQPEDAFNAYARFASDYSSCMPGAQFNGATVDEASAWGANDVGQGIGGAVNGDGNEGCVPPALLFAGVGSPGKSGNPKKSQHGSKGAHAARAQAPTQNGQSNQSGATAANATPQLSTTTAAQSSSASHNTISAPTPSYAPVTTTATASPSASLQRPPTSLLMSKPFRCPKPNCNKSYKQANGLKYHMTHGSCNFAPPKDLEHVKDLLERKRREREANGGQPSGGQGSGLVRSTSLGSAPQPMINGQSHSQTPSHSQTQPGTPLSPTSILSLTPADLAHISESDLVEVEREAERRLRPFACGVGECTRRYKNMNGLRYHYQHSGDHGAVGLALLASGVHECLGGKRGQAGHNQNQNQNQNQHSQPQQAGAHRLGGGGKGSVSVPVSRAGSVSVATSRVGTPAPHGQSAFMSTYGQQHQSQQQQQQHAYALPPMTLGLGLQPLGAASNASSTATLTPNTMSNLKTTAITPTTAPPMAVQAQAFVVPQATSQFQAQHSRSSSGTSNASPSRPGSAGTHAQAQQQPQTQQASPQSQLNVAQGQYAYPSSVYQHYAQQQQRYGLGLGLGKGVALGTGPSGSANVNVLGANSTLNSPLNPTTAAAPSSAAEASPAASSSSSSSGNSGSPSASGAEYGGGLFLNAHGEFVASEDALGLGFGQQNAEHGHREMGLEEQEQDAARAAAMYARQQHQQNAAGVGMEL